MSRKLIDLFSTSMNIAYNLSVEFICRKNILLLFVLFKKKVKLLQMIGGVRIV